MLEDSKELQSVLLTTMKSLEQDRKHHLFGNGYVEGIKVGGTEYTAEYSHSGPTGSEPLCSY
jgi:hypothetical protein